MPAQSKLLLMIDKTVMINMIIDDKDNNDDHNNDQNDEEDDKHLRPMSVTPGALIIKGALAATFH